MYKICLIFLTSFIFFQLFLWQSEASKIVFKRETESSTAKNANSIDEALDALKKGLADLSQKIQDNDVLQNISKSLTEFSHQVGQQSDQILQKVLNQNKATTAQN